MQSLRDEQLRKLGRIHTATEAKAALDIARATFERFSFDLIYARPGQTPDDWRTELSEALDLAGDHLSLYQLTIEPDTPYAALHAAGKLVVPDDNAARALYEITGTLTEARGLSAYEVSNYARPGSESRHNLLYWRYGEYAGRWTRRAWPHRCRWPPARNRCGTQSRGLGGARRDDGQRQCRDD